MRARAANEYSGAARAPETRRVYSSLWRGWSDWASENGWEPVPAAPESVAAYLEERAGADSLSTLRSRRVAISQEHLDRGLPDPSATQRTHLLFVRLNREMGAAQKQARGINARHLQGLRAAAAG